MIEEGCADTSDAIFDIVPIAPLLCDVASTSEITLTFSLEDSCTNDSHTASFTIQLEENIIVSCPNDTIVANL